MGRPVNKRNFGNPNYAATGEAVGGEGVSAIAIAAPIAASLNAETTTVTFSAPQIAGGQTATGTAVIDGNGDLTGITITDSGSGYTSRPTISVVDSDGPETLTLTHGAGGVTITLTSNRTDAIAVQAITSGSTNRTSGNDIIKQVGSKKFKVRSQDGTAVCKLAGATPAAVGEMTIIATDSGGATYHVTKLYNRTCRLVNIGGTPEFSNNVKVRWTLGSAEATVSVSLAKA